MSETPRHEELTSGHGSDDPVALTTFVVGAVSVILLAVLLIGLETLYHRTVEREFQRKVVAAAPQELRQLRADQLEQLNGYRWIDRGQGVVAIPIDRAMELVAEDARRDLAPGR